MASLHSDVYDSGLSVLDTAGDVLVLCSQEPTTYAEANATYKLASKTALNIGAPAARTGGGRKVTVVAISDGSVTATGTATHWAILATATSRLLASAAVSASQALTSGNTFTLAAFDLGIPSPV